MLKRLANAICLFILCMTMTTAAFAADSNFFKDFTVAENLAFADAANGHFINARQKAEAILKDDPESIGGLYTMAYVFWEGEGNLTRAMQYIKKTRATFEAKYCGEKGIPTQGDEQAFHQRILRDLAAVYAELDQRENELGVHEEMAELYHTPLTESAVWPLIKLSRFDEAEAIAKHTIATRAQFTVSQAYNDLTALEDAKHKHLASFHASEKSVEIAADKSCVVLLNHARSYATLLNAPKAIEYFIKANKPHDRDCVTDPLSSVSEIYLIDGAWQKAISSMTKARKKRVEKRYVIQTEKEQRKNIAEIFHEMGYAERAYPLMKTVIDAPGRLGYDSLPQTQVNMAFAVIFYAISNDAYQRADEKISILSKLNFFWLFKPDIRSQMKDLMEQRGNIERKRWSTHQKLFKQALNPVNTRSFVVPFYVLSPEYYYAIVDILGRKTTEYLIKYEEDWLEPEEIEIMHPVFDLTRGYIQWRAGNDDAALAYLDTYDKHAPKQMKLLDMQSMIMRAMIYQKQGKTAESLEIMQTVFQNHPAIFRHFDLKLPVAFDDATNWSDNDYSDIRSIIRSSNRFEESEQSPFVISAAPVGHIIQICLSSKYGSRYACTTTNPKDYNADPNVPPQLADIIDNFFHVAFSPKVDASQADINSLDGSPIQVTSDQALQNLINASPQLTEE